MAQVYLHRQLSSGGKIFHPGVHDSLPLTGTVEAYLRQNNILVDVKGDGDKKPAVKKAKK